MTICWNDKARKQSRLWIVWTLALGGLVSCVPPPPPPPLPTQQVMEFNEGIQHIAQTLVKQFALSQYNVQRQDTLLEIKKTLGQTPDVVPRKTVIDPFLVADTGEMLKANYIIENLMARAMTPHLGIAKMAPENLSTAEYMINGMITLEMHPTIRQKTYRIYASLLEKKAGMIVGSSDVWIKTLDYQPLDIYKDSPVYLKDRDLDTLAASVKRNIGQTVDPAYLATLDVRSLLVAGDALYEKRDWDNAAQFYEEVERRPDGKTMKVYAGLYNLYRVRQDANRSEAAFVKLLEVSVAEKKRNCRQAPVCREFHGFRQ